MKYNKELERIEIGHRELIDSTKEEIKDRLFEQEHELTRTKNQSQREIHEVENRHSEVQKDVWSGVKEYRNRSKEVQVSHRNFMIQLRKEHKHRIASCRNDFKFESKEISTHYDRQIKQVREEMEEINKKELKAWEKEKEIQTKEKIKAQELVRISLCNLSRVMSRIYTHIVFFLWS